MESVSQCWDTLRVGSVVWHVAGGARERVADWLSAHFPGVLDDASALMKRGVGTRVARAAGWVLKESQVRRGRSAWRFGFRRSGSRRAFILGKKLIGLGIPTSDPVAWATVRRCGLRRCDYLISGEIERGIPLKQRLLDVADEVTERGRLVEELGALMAAFHGNGLSNRDMKHSNLVYRVGAEAGARLWVLDMDGVRRCRITRRRAWRDLYRVVHSLGLYGWSSESDRTGLLVGYNAVVPARLRLDALPHPQWAAQHGRA